MALHRHKMQDSGAHATLLLECFIENEGRLLASTVYARKLCEIKQFREWRKILIDKEWLIWNESQLDKGIYYPGKKLVPYINKENMARKEIATRESVENLKKELDARIDAKASKNEFEMTKNKLALTSNKLEETSNRLEETNRTVMKIAKAVRDLQEAMIPPDSVAKMLRRERAAKRIADLARAN